MKPVRATAHALLGAIFVADGMRAACSPDQFAGPARRVTDRLVPPQEWAGRGLPTDPRTLVRITGLVHAGGGLMLATGRATRPAAAVVAATLLPTTIAVHPFWTCPDPARRDAQRRQFLKNLGLLGGLLLAAVDTGGRPGLRWRAGRLVRRARHRLKVP